MATIVVCGFGRCGSSLVMQMLAAGGLPCLGAFPAFEDDRAKAPMTPEFSAACAGHAVKILDPQRIGLPDRARVVWLYRNTSEQAKSFAKFLRMVAGMPVTRDERRGIERGFRQDERDAMRAIAGRPTLALHFEQILWNPLRAAQQLAEFTGTPGFDAAAAARAVLPRPPRCMPGMGVELMLLAQAGGR